MDFGAWNKRLSLAENRNESEARRRVQRVIENKKQPISLWEKWLEHPEKLLVRHIFFQAHLWLGTVVAAYILLRSTSGNAIVFRNELAGNLVVPCNETRGVEMFSIILSLNLSSRRIQNRLVIACITVL